MVVSWAGRELQRTGDLSQFLQQAFNIRQLVDGIHLRELNHTALVDNECRTFADPRHRRLVAQDAELARDFSVRIEVRTQRKPHHADFLALPGQMAFDGVDADIEQLSPCCLETGFERIQNRQLRLTRRRPVQRMESHYHVFFAEEVAEPELAALFTLHRRQDEIRSPIADLQCHHYPLALPPDCNCELEWPPESGP